MKNLFLLAFLFAQTAGGGNWSDAVDLYQKGRFQQAAGIFADLAHERPDDPEPRFWLAKARFKLGKLDEAIEEFEAAVDIAPDNSAYHLWLGRAYGQKASQVNFLSAFRLARKTVHEFETAVKLAPENTDARFDLLAFYAQAPGIVGGGKDKAEQQAKEIGRIQPRMAYAARAALAEANKEWDVARKEYVQATEKYPQNADVWSDLAGFLLDRQDYRGAETSARRAVELNPRHATARMQLAAAQAKLRDDPARAIETLRNLSRGPLTDDDPSFHEIYYWLGEAYLAAGNIAEARRSFKISLEFVPSYSKAKDALSQIG